MADLKYIETLSVEKFKQKHNASAIDIYRSPKTGKLAFDAGSVKGAVSENYKENPVISLVEGDQGSFFLLHKKSNANVLDTL